jgi:hypothetical protein
MLKKYMVMNFLEKGQYYLKKNRHIKNFVLNASDFGETGEEMMQYTRDT